MVISHHLATKFASEQADAPDQDKLREAIDWIQTYIEPRDVFTDDQIREAAGIIKDEED